MLANFSPVEPIERNDDDGIFEIKVEEEARAAEAAEQKAAEAAKQKAAEAAKQKAAKEKISKGTEFTKNSKLEDLATFNKEDPNSEFEFKEGVVQTDENGKYISIDGKKYYEKPHDESEKKPGLKYYEVERNTPRRFELQF